MNHTSSSLKRTLRTLRRRYRRIPAAIRLPVEWVMRQKAIAAFNEHVLPALKDGGATVGDFLSSLPF